MGIRRPIVVKASPYLLTVLLGGALVLAGGSHPARAQTVSDDSGTQGTSLGTQGTPFTCLLNGNISGPSEQDGFVQALSENGSWLAENSTTLTIDKVLHTVSGTIAPETLSELQSFAPLSLLQIYSGLPSDPEATLLADCNIPSFFGCALTGQVSGPPKQIAAFKLKNPCTGEEPPSCTNGEVVYDRGSGMMYGEILEAALKNAGLGTTCDRIDVTVWNYKPGSTGGCDLFDASPVATCEFPGAYTSEPIGEGPPGPQGPQGPRGTVGFICNDWHNKRPPGEKKVTISFNGWKYSSGSDCTYDITATTELEWRGTWWRLYSTDVRSGFSSKQEDIEVNPIQRKSKDIYYTVWKDHVVGDDAMSRPIWRTDYSLIDGGDSELTMNHSVRGANIFASSIINRHYSIEEAAEALLDMDPDALKEILDVPHFPASGFFDEEQERKRNKHLIIFALEENIGETLGETPEAPLDLAKGNHQIRPYADGVSTNVTTKTKIVTKGVISKSESSNEIEYCYEAGGDASLRTSSQVKSLGDMDKASASIWGCVADAQNEDVNVPDTNRYGISRLLEGPAGKKLAQKYILLEKHSTKAGSKTEEPNTKSTWEAYKAVITGAIGAIPIVGDAIAAAIDFSFSLSTEEKTDDLDTLRSKDANDGDEWKGFTPDSELVVDTCYDTLNHASNPFKFWSGYEKSWLAAKRNKEVAIAEGEIFHEIRLFGYCDGSEAFLLHILQKPGKNPTAPTKENPTGKNHLVGYLYMRGEGAKRIPLYIDEPTKNGEVVEWLAGKPE